jgi:polysaccharide export outer membrane protein
MARSTWERFIPVLGFSTFAAITIACSSGLGGSIPVDQYKEPAGLTPAEYVINNGDTLSVAVWEQPNMSGKMRVRSDGKISLPLLQDIDAAGKTPSKLVTDIEASLKTIILNPRVTVVVEESKPPTIAVMGEVNHPGPVPVDPQTGVVQALAAAGGLTTFAHKDRIFVVRQTPAPVRIHFTYEELTRTAGPASAFRLRPGDMVVVE